MYLLWWHCSPQLTVLQCDQYLCLLCMLLYVDSNIHSTHRYWSHRTTVNTSVVFFWSSSCSLLAHETANGTFGFWILVSVCKVPVWHLERYACAAWHYDSPDISDINVSRNVLHHNVSPWIRTLISFTFVHKYEHWLKLSTQLLRIKGLIYTKDTNSYCSIFFFSCLQFYRVFSHLDMTWT